MRKRTLADLFREDLEYIGWSPAIVGQKLGCAEELVVAWVGGTEPIPSPVSVWVRHTVQAIMECPPPQRWQHGNPPIPRGKPALCRVCRCDRNFHPADHPYQPFGEA